MFGLLFEILKLLQRMMSPNVDMQCMAKQAMVDSYWQTHNKDLSHSMQSQLCPLVDQGKLKPSHRMCIELRIIQYSLRKRFKQVNSPDLSILESSQG